MSSIPGIPNVPNVPTVPGEQRNPLTDAINRALAATIEQLMPQIVAGVVGALVGALGGLFTRKTVPVPDPAAPPAPPAPPVVTPAGPLPQVPIPVRATVASIRTVVQNVEKPQRVGGGPGVNYEDARGMIARGEAFNFGCVAFLDSTAYDADGDEFTGGATGKLVANDLEFRGRYRVYRGGNLVAFIEGAGDDNPAGEGKPLPWHQSPSGAVNFGQGKWMATSSMGVRMTFLEEGDYEIEFELSGVTSARIPFRVS